jgi:hypothetical protein
MKRFIAALFGIAALAAGPLVISNVYMQKSGVVVIGKVLAKREAILMPGGDTWKHIFEITYEYRPFDSSYNETVVQRVDAGLYRGLQVGSAVEVRYSPSRLLRSFAGMGVYLDGSSNLSRLHYGPPGQGDIAKAGAIARAAVFGLIAYWFRNKTLGIIAAVILLACFPAVLLAACGFILFPALFWASRRSPGKGYGLALLVTIALCSTVVFLRIPHPAPLPPGRVHNGIALVRQARVVDEIWSDAWEIYSARKNGQNVGQPFEMVDLEFTPQGAIEPIHVLDHVDLNSVPDLREGASVPIQYSLAEPDSAEIAGASRRYALQNATYLLLFAYGIGAIVTLVLVPIGRGFGKMFRSSPVLRNLTDPGAALTRISEVSRLSQLPADDPRRQRLEAALAACQGGRPHTDDRQNTSQRGDEK